MKEIGKTLTALGLSEGSKIKVQIGSPVAEGVYEVNIVAVQIADVKGNDHEFFTEEKVGKLNVPMEC